jgi:two-component system, OmpR family, alkaline phosphatase synthesis response regulator PhoP
VAPVLVVEDQPAIAEPLEAALAEAGHDVLSAGNGQHGLEILRQREPDVVLLDYLMPSWTVRRC